MEGEQASRYPPTTNMQLVTKHTHKGAIKGMFNIKVRLTERSVRSRSTTSIRKM